jgi:ankyrin repeat protein
VDRKEEVEYILSSVPALKVNQKTSDTKRTALHGAVERQNIDVVETLLGDERVDANVEDATGDSPHALAAKQGAVRVLEVLLANRLNPGSRLRGPFLTAVEFSQDEVVKYLVTKYPADIDLVAFVDSSRRNAFHLCAFSGDVELARYLLEKCNKREQKTALLKKDSQGQTPKDVTEVRDHEAVARLFNAFLLQEIDIVVVGEVEDSGWRGTSLSCTFCSRP